MAADTTSLTFRDHPNPDALLSQKQVAELIGCSLRTLERRRLVGDGIPFVRLGPKMIRYRLSDVTAYINARVHGSTSEPGS